MFSNFRNLKTLFVFLFYSHLSVKESFAHALIKLFELIMMFNFPIMNTSVLISRAFTLIMVNHTSDLFTLLLFSQTVRQSVRQTDRQSDSQSVSQIDRQIDSETDRQ